jgi:transcriptional regulator with XRE-family HTH domain
MNDVNIGQIIKELRLFRNMDEARFAERCKVDLSVVEGWENDTNIPTVMELHKIARVLQVSMDYFFREQERDIESSEECCNAIITAMYLMTEIQNVNVGRRTLLWRMIREELLGYILKKLDIPKFSIKNTTEKQRREIVGSFDELFGDEYDEVILGYIKGKNELNLLKNEYFEIGQKYKTAELTEREEKNETSTWKIYTQCVYYLDRAINAEFVDLRYAGVAVEKLKEAGVAADLSEGATPGAAFQYRNLRRALFGRLASYLLAILWALGKSGADDEEENETWWYISGVLRYFASRIYLEQIAFTTGQGVVSEVNSTNITTPAGFSAFLGTLESIGMFLGSLIWDEYDEDSPISKKVRYEKYNGEKNVSKSAVRLQKSLPYYKEFIRWQDMHKSAESVLWAREQKNM